MFLGPANSNALDIAGIFKFVEVETKQFDGTHEEHQTDAIARDVGKFIGK